MKHARMGPPSDFTAPLPLSLLLWILLLVFDENNPTGGLGNLSSNIHAFRVVCYKVRGENLINGPSAGMVVRELFVVWVGDHDHTDAVLSDWDTTMMSCLKFTSAIVPTFI